MSNVEGTLDFWLEQGTALRMLYQRAEPYLIWSNFVTPIQDDDSAFIYTYDAVGMAADPKIRQPAHVMVGGDFPEIDMSRPTVASGMTSQRGFSVRLKHDVIRKEPRGISEVLKAYKFAGYWMAKYMNDLIIATMKTGYTTASMTPKAVWSADTCNPIDDMEVIEAEMDREGYAYQFTDMFVHKTNWYEAKRYLTATDLSALKQQSMYGMPVIKKDRMTIPVVDADLVKIKSGITEGSFLCLDRNNPGVELHYYNDAKFASDKVSYTTVIDGVEQVVEAINIGFHFEQIEDPNNHDIKLKFWNECKPVVTQAYAGLYKSSGI